MPDLHFAINVIARIIEFLGVLLIAGGFAIAGARFFMRQRPDDRYRQLRLELGRSILLGLEVLVAADIIATVTISPTLQEVLILAIIVLIRTFLSFSIEIEVEGRIPWRRNRQSGSGPS